MIKAATMNTNHRTAIILMILALALGVCVTTVCGQEPATGWLSDYTERFDKFEKLSAERHQELLDEIHANHEVMEGPIIDAWQRALDKFRAEDQQEMQSLRDWLNKDRESTDREYKGILDRFREREQSERAQYETTKGLLERLLDRDPSTPVFPRVAEFRDGMNEAVVVGTGPIREALSLLVNLVFGMVVLVLLGFGYSVYRDFRPRV